MSKIELLAPAGSYEALVAAVENGADAIYLGGNEFSARAFATNFNRDELKQAVAYSHLRNVKIYVTINTLYEDNQFKQLHDYLLFLLNINVDALIIQDMGLVNYIQTYFPEFEIHLSTQTSIRNLAGVQYFENRKISRVVLARENTLEEMNVDTSSISKDEGYVLVTDENIEGNKIVIRGNEKRIKHVEICSCRRCVNYLKSEFLRSSDDTDTSDS